ncbi:hypothetical protein BX600DRAFT_467049 [Xylariales sp. PMI_506]|nr:hypothetical protein BX600DRAFT_467049 [Xylariales sp. PMI_506]
MKLHRVHSHVNRSPAAHHANCSGILRKLGSLSFFHTHTHSGDTPPPPYKTIDLLSP